MAIQLEANYSKKLGLPDYSSHQFSVQVRTELNDMGQISKASQELYQRLQTAVDNNIKEAGYLPSNSGKQVNGGYQNTNTNDHRTSNTDFHCSPKQKELLIKIVTENNLDKGELNQQVQQQYGKEVSALSKHEMSEFLSQLMENYSAKKHNGFNRQTAVNGNGGWQ